MKRIRLAVSGLAVAATLALAPVAQATPTTTYWTPASSDIQPYGVYHLGVDNYFTVGRKAQKGDLPTDVGITVGILPYEKLQMEVGIDLLEPSTDPLYFNAKIGSPEGALFEGSPAWNLGIFNVGTDKKAATEDSDGRTDYNIIHLMFGKTIPMGLGRIHAGVYSGNGKTLVDKNGDKENTGYMVGWDKGFSPAKAADGSEYMSWVLAADYASGKNAIGGGGFGVYRYFTKNISFLTGPVWFNEPSVVGVNESSKWVWTTQFDVNF